jgi:hypothetical protein
MNLLIVNKKEPMTIDKLKSANALTQNVLYLFPEKMATTEGIDLGEQKSSVRTLPIILGVVIIVLALLVVLMFVNVVPTLNSNRAPKLVNVGLGSRDLGQDAPLYTRAVHVEGYVCNIGVETAYKTKLHVIAYYVTGAVALDQYVNIGDGGIIYGGGESTKVDMNIPYSGDADIGNVILTPEWSPSP